MFGDMLRRSIPQYDVMRRSVFELGASFVRQNTTVVDLGCSRGDALEPFVKRFGASCYYLGVDVSDPMLEYARERFKRYRADGVPVDVEHYDLRRAYPSAARRGDGASCTLAVLTLQFVPIEYRFAVLRAAYRATVPGGALILVEKVLGSTADIDRQLVTRYLEHKREQGYSEEQIERKRLSLEGVLVPVTAAWNEDALHAAGFRQVDSFWRWMNFAGWIAVREE